MSNLPALGADGVTIQYLAATGTGTDLDPYIPIRKEIKEFKPVSYDVAIAITKSDSTNFAAGTCQAIYVGNDGDISGVVNGNLILFKAVPVGIFPVKFSRINLTNTTADDLIAFY